MRYMLMAKNVILASTSGQEPRTPHSTDSLSLLLHSLFADDFLSPSSLPWLCPSVGEDKASVKTSHVPSSPLCLVGEVSHSFNPAPSHYKNTEKVKSYFKISPSTTDSGRIKIRQQEIPTTECCDNEGNLLNLHAGKLTRLKKYKLPHSPHSTINVETHPSAQESGKGTG